jgi:hypothetical protein
VRLLLAAEVQDVLFFFVLIFLEAVSESPLEYTQ